LRLQDLPGSIAYRLRKPSLWTSMALYWLCWGVLKRMWPRPRWRVSVTEETCGALVTLGLMALAAVPWQWTGDARRRTGIPRGMIQALAWNALWLGALMAVLVVLLPAGRPDLPFSIQMPFMRQPLPPEAGILIGNFPLAFIFGWFLASQDGAEAEARASLELADQARIQTLQAQLHPHTLFNVLSGLTELVHEDPDSAEEALVQLVELYRKLMTQSTSVNLPLAQERELITRYLGIMDLRLGSRLEVHWDWEPWVDTRVGDRLQLLVANTGKPLKAGCAGGVGLGNLKERLALLPRLKPELELRQDGEWVTARLTLAWNGPA